MGLHRDYQRITLTNISTKITMYNLIFRKLLETREILENFIKYQKIL